MPDNQQGGIGERVAWLEAVVGSMQHSIRANEIVLSDTQDRERVRLRAADTYGSVIVTSYDHAGRAHRIEVFAADELDPGDGTDGGLRT